MRPFLVSPSAPDRGAQCPNCFTYNLLDYLPEAKKRVAPGNCWDLQCALCGSEFRVSSDVPAAA